MNDELKNLFEVSLDEPKEFKTSIAYFLDGNGIVERRKMMYGYIYTQHKDVIPCLDPTDKKLVFTLNKIPIRLLNQIITFFKDVNDKYSTEALIELFYNKLTKTYNLYVHPQEVSKAAVHRKNEIKNNHVAENIKIADIHSHNTMGAFFSGTDDKDENAGLIYGVVGEITQETPNILFRIKYQDRPQINITINDIFDIKGKYKYRKETYPSAWMDCVEIAKPVEYVYDGEAFEWPTIGRNEYGGDSRFANPFEDNSPKNYWDEWRKNNVSKYKEEEIIQENLKKLMPNMNSQSDKYIISDTAGFISENFNELNIQCQIYVVKELTKRIKQ